MDGPLAGRKRDQPNHQCKQRWYSGMVCCKKSYHICRKNVTKYSIVKCWEHVFGSLCIKIRKDRCFHIFPFDLAVGGGQNCSKFCPPGLYSPFQKQNKKNVGKFWKLEKLYYVTFLLSNLFTFFATDLRFGCQATRNSKCIQNRDIRRLFIT